MKKVLFSSLILGSAFALASCSADEPAANAGGDGLVTVNISLPEIATRALGDKPNCNKLVYSIMNADGTKAIYSNIVKDAFGEGVTEQSLTLQLVPGETYGLAFYAYNGKSEFSEFNDGTIKVYYDKMNPNEEIDDAFYYYDYITPAAGDQLNITLNRAFAQLNFGTSDIEEPAVNAALAKLSYSLSITDGVYTTFDTKAKNGEPSGAGTISLTGSVPAKNDNFTVAGISGVTSIYVLTSKADQSLIEGTYQTLNGATPLRDAIDLSNVPVQMNYRTNIYGQLLSSNLPVTVKINPLFNGIINADVWNGEVTDEDKVDITAPALSINTAAQFVSLVQQSIASGNMGNKPITLESDLDFNNIPLTIENEKNLYQLNLDGNGHTIYNMKIGDNNGTNNGIFPNLTSSTVKNLNFVNCSVEGGTYAGIIAGTTYGTITVENVTFNNCTVSGQKKCAVVVGFSAENSLTCNNVIANNCTVTAPLGQAGTICGYVSLGKFTDCSISNCTVSAGVETGDNFTSHGSSCFVGVLGTFGGTHTLDFTNCKMTDCTLICLDPAYTSEFEAVKNRLWGSARGTGTITVDGEVVFSNTASN